MEELPVSGIEEVARRIQAEFEKIHHGHPAPVKEKSPAGYTNVAERKFRQRAKHLVRSATLLDALTSSSHILKARTNGNVWAIEVPQESAEDLIKATLGEDELEDE
jgi:hypothetical protein